MNKLSNRSKFRIGLQALTVTALVGTLTLLSACGESDDTALTKAEFIKQGNAICRAGLVAKSTSIAVGLKQQEKGSASLTSPSNQEQFVIAWLAPPIRTMADELEELGTPADDEQAALIVEGIDQTLTRVEASPDVALGAVDPFTDVNKLSRKYGLKVCALL